MKLGCRGLASVLLLAALSLPPALSALCLAWCDNPVVAARHHLAADDGRSRLSRGEAAPDDEAAPCHGPGAAATGSTAIGTRPPAPTCADVLTAAELHAAGSPRLVESLPAPAVIAAVLPGAACSRRPDAHPPAGPLDRTRAGGPGAPLPLRI